MTSRRIALLIDADNISHTKISLMLAELSKYGSVSIRRAYGDWSKAELAGWKARLPEFAIRPVQQCGYSAGKNATDMALVIDAMDLLHTQQPDAFCLASSDADFMPLAMRVRECGYDVYGFGEAKTPKPFVNACTAFFCLDALEDVSPADTLPMQAVAPACKPAVKQAARPLSQDAALVRLLRDAVEAVAQPDGWAPLSLAGSAASKRAIDPKRYGAKNFSALFARTDLFVIAKAKGGHPYIADKRNKARSPQPGG